MSLFSSRCILELKFAIYYRAASLPSQASYAVLAEESQVFFKHSPHTNSISNSEIISEWPYLIMTAWITLRYKNTLQFSNLV